MKLEPYLMYKIKPMWIKWQNIKTVYKRIRIKIQYFRNCGAGEPRCPKLQIRKGQDEHIQ